MLPRAQLDVAASLGASPLRVLRSVVMPEAWPALMAGGSLVLLLTLNEFGIVLFTGAKGVITLPVLIYTRGHRHLRPARRRGDRDRADRAVAGAVRRSTG